ncbi:hypothetical protein [Haloarcula marina]|uniref:hypothetical protein n=1 Tax=Haloarcula marina TaxID=2961574 RepID=UPI0020B7D141|nr:hypothetical protein [Halomicroarcula marina]
MPDPVAGYEPRPYPDPPGEDSETAAEEFALAYERAITYNHWLANNISEDTDSFSVDVTAGPTEEAGNGYLVGLDWSAYDTTEEDAIGEASGAIVYYIALRVGIRAYPDSKSIHDVSLPSCDCTVLGTVYC